MSTTVPAQEDDMADVHQLITLHGREEAKSRMDGKDRHLVDLAANVMEQKSPGSASPIPILPHVPSSPADRNRGDLGEAQRQHYFGHLAGHHADRLTGAEIRRTPYGSRARMILLYLQTQALRTGSPEVELGPSLNAWMKRMNVPLGGKSRDLIREQANRLSACILTFYYHNRMGRGFEKDSIIKGGFSFADGIGGDQQPRLWEDSVRLGDMSSTR